MAASSRGMFNNFLICTHSAEHMVAAKARKTEGRNKFGDWSLRGTTKRKG